MATTAQIPSQMKSGYYYGHSDVRVENRPVPTIAATEVLAAVYACGICGSDTMRWYREPEAQKRGALNTGHEIAGQLVAVGAQVPGYQPGDRVVITHHFPCLKCTACLDGNETACEAMHTKHIDPGGFAQYVRILQSGIANGLYRIPDAMTYEEASFVEPLACVVRSVRKMLPVKDHSALVIGSGLAGLLHIKLLRAMGAGRIIAADMNQERLDAALRSGATEVLMANEKLPSADRVILCTGAPAAAVHALECINRGGHIMFFAADGPDKKLEIPLTQFWISQPAVQFSYGAAPRDMTEAMEWISTGRVKVADLVTHRFTLDGLRDAFDLASNPRANSLKVILEPQAS
jgi:L-iditol 2-dehydrogenase